MRPSLQVKKGREKKDNLQTRKKSLKRIKTSALRPRTVWCCVLNTQYCNSGASTPQPAQDGTGLNVSLDFP